MEDYALHLVDSEIRDRPRRFNMQQAVSKPQMHRGCSSGVQNSRCETLLPLIRCDRMLGANVVYISIRATIRSALSASSDIGM